ncbi:uncharacterized protein TRUGW13939_05591 [Talaromyces rugulosus]|uniref:Uncharacterized protein n=1 Tax=Talaromyces rugulosus TaxID=121627 RepID=A0A7H8QX05_TALRU|nr:uncharacterized protein TRUGW13939_05591 [Talaromyces rugulosus]QKX58467.1 hypothetical protein TRUGW13939_05591 [Talaromyces rugulosus]
MIVAGAGNTLTGYRPKTQRAWSGLSLVTLSAQASQKKRHLLFFLFLLSPPVVILVAVFILSLPRLASLPIRLLRVDTVEIKTLHTTYSATTPPMNSLVLSRQSSTDPGDCHSI